MKGNFKVLLDNRWILTEERAGMSKQANPRAESSCMAGTGLCWCLESWQEPPAGAPESKGFL